MAGVEVIPHRPIGLETLMVLSMFPAAFEAVPAMPMSVVGTEGSRTTDEVLAVPAPDVIDHFADVGEVAGVIQGQACADVWLRHLRWLKLLK